MKVQFIIIAFLFLFSQNSFCQNEFQYCNYGVIIENADSKIKSITRYVGNLKLEDSTAINANFEDKLSLKEIEHYNSHNQLKRIEYYNRNGKLRDAFNSYYNENKLTLVQLDSTFNNGLFQRTEYQHKNDTVNITTYYSEDESFTNICIYDSKQNLISEYSPTADGGIIDRVDYGYDSSNNEIYMIYEEKGKVQKIVTSYDEMNRPIKKMRFNSAGETIEQKDISYLVPDRMVVIKSNNITGKNSKKTIIDFKDEQGNIVKSYINLSRSPKNWIVVYYKIEYREPGN